MSERIGNVFVVQEEPTDMCEMCGKIAELRPYGPMGERICFECAMKDMATTCRRFDEMIDGVEVAMIVPKGNALDL